MTERKTRWWYCPKHHKLVAKVGFGDDKMISEHRQKYLDMDFQSCLEDFVIKELTP